jgi:penicillin-binding protein 1C
MYQKYGSHNKNWQKKLKKKSKGKNNFSKYNTKSIKKYSSSPKKKKKNNKIIKKIIKIILILFILGILSFFGLIIIFSQGLPETTDLISKQETSSLKLYDRTGETLLYDFGSGNINRTKKTLNQIPDYVKWSTIVAEDRQFYSHNGINFRGILRAIFNNIFSSSTSGGSSISQQFVKNSLLSGEKSYIRKIKEAILTWRLEQKFTKDEILELYLNEIPYGGTAYGIEAASKKYFDKSAEELTLAEAATLAALPQRPSYLSPYGSHLDSLLGRKDWILDSLVQEGYLLEEEVEIAKKEELKFSKISSGSIVAPHFVFYVKDLLVEKYGEQKTSEDGLKVITTLDIEKQKIAEKIISEKSEDILEKYNAGNVALLSLDNKTGEILTMVGSKNYFDEDIDGAVNITTSLRQPGSSIKPVVYAAAFEKGYSPSTILFDVLTDFTTKDDLEKGEEYIPHNYGDNIFGPVSIRKALAGSLNIPAVKTIYLVGVDKFLDFAEKIGYSTFEDRSRFGLSLVLGGGEIKMIEHITAFTSFNNDGELLKNKAILKVTDNKNKTLEEFNPKKNKKKKVFDEEISKQITNVLSDNGARSYIFGEQNSLTLPDRQVAAKTGTTNDYKDAWTIGYTPEIITCVWAGNTKGGKMKGSASGGNVAGPIWQSFMKEVTKETEVTNFEKPKEKSLPEKPMFNGKIAGEQKIKIDKISGKLATEYTPQNLIIEKTFREIHNILHYTNTNNPLGKIPSSPENDDQYFSWEKAVTSWAEENEYETNTDIPTDIDDLHSPEFTPELRIINLRENKTITNPELNITIETNSKRGVEKVEYYLDDILLQTNFKPNFNLNNFKLIGFKNTEHIIKIISKDEYENQNSKEIKIFLELSSEYSEPITFIQPKQNNNLVAEMFPYEIITNISNYDYYQKIDFYIKKENEKSGKWIGWQEINSEKIFHTWTDIPNEKGIYSVYGLITSKNNQTTESEKIEIEIK